MQKNILYSLLVCMLIQLGDSPLLAQEEQKWPVKISIMDESIMLPGFQFLEYSFNPALLLGTEYILKSSERQDWHLTGNLGAYYHEKSQVGLFLQSELGYRRYIGRWNIHARLGVGYLHSFSTKPVYFLENGEIDQGTDTGNPTFMPSVSLGVGYRLKDDAYSPEIFLTWMNTGELPLNFYTTVHQFTGVGIKFYPFR